ncbi:unnamed protein product [Lampetra fluviatilis]
MGGAVTGRPWEAPGSQGLARSPPSLTARLHDPSPARGPPVPHHPQPRERPVARGPPGAAWGRLGPSARPGAARATSGAASRTFSFNSRARPPLRAPLSGPRARCYPEEEEVEVASRRPRRPRSVARLLQEAAALDGNSAGEGRRRDPRFPRTTPPSHAIPLAAIPPPSRTRQPDTIHDYRSNRFV